MTGTRTPRDARDLWKTPDGNDSNDSDDFEIVQKVKQETDYAVFETEAPEVDFHELNEQDIE